jgi:hypothetical protein
VLFSTPTRWEARVGGPAPRGDIFCGRGKLASSVTIAALEDV